MLVKPYSMLQNDFPWYITGRSCVHVCFFFFIIQKGYKRSKETRGFRNLI